MPAKPVPYSLPRVEPYLPLLALCTAMTAVSCSMGALGQSVTAEASGGSEPLNAPLAIGASYRPNVRVSTRGSATPSMRLLTTRPDVVAVENGELVGKRRGVAAILFTTSESTVVDFLHVWVEQPTHVALHRLSPTGSDLGEVRDRIDLLAGDSVWLSPRVYADAQSLAGSSASQWRVDPPVARVLRDGVYQQRRLVADRAGRATLTVSLLGVAARAEIVVEPTAAQQSAPAPRPILMPTPSASPTPVPTPPQPPKAFPGGAP